MPSAMDWSASGRRPAGAAGAAGSRPQPLDDPLAMRHAGPDLLSLALIDARNLLLHRLAQEESEAALRIAARAGAWQEHWITCHVQRQRGEASDPRAPRLAGIDPRIDAWFRGDLPAPAPQAVRDYLAATLEVTLELLAGLAEDADDAALHFYRLAVLHDDRLGEALAERLSIGAPPARVQREPIWVPAQRARVGATRPAAGEPIGLVPHNERWAHEVAVPEFEIDAQAVNWGQFAEFAADGGYDRRELWTDAGWAWAQALGRRAPAQVAQIQGGVVVRSGPGPQAGLERAPAGQAAMHLSRFEAEAWCRWAGRRLPTEPEWELAAQAAARRGFVRGDVFEWVLGSARAWPDAGPCGAGSLDPIPPAELRAGDTERSPPRSARTGVLRGASFATRLRWGQASARRFVDPARDSMFCGFRSCSI